MTTIFLVLNILIYLIFCTVHIYSPTRPPYNPPSTLDFLFQIGGLHVYGIRGLFMGVVLSVSILCVAMVVYIAVAHRRNVGVSVGLGDAQREGWRVCSNEGSLSRAGLQSQPSRRMVGNVLPSWNKRSNTKREKKKRSFHIRPSLSGFYPPDTQIRSSRLSTARLIRVARRQLNRQTLNLQQAPGPVPFLPVRSRERHIHKRMHWSRESRARLSTRRTTVARMVSGASSGYEIP